MTALYKFDPIVEKDKNLHENQIKKIKHQTKVGRGEERQR